MTFCAAKRQRAFSPSGHREVSQSGRIAARAQQSPMLAIGFRCTRPRDLSGIDRWAEPLFCMPCNLYAAKNSWRNDGRLLWIKPPNWRFWFDWLTSRRDRTVSAVSLNSVNPVRRISFRLRQPTSRANEPFAMRQRPANWQPARICEWLGVKFPEPTWHQRWYRHADDLTRHRLASDAVADDGVGSPL